MTERPIIFSGPMVRAILAGKKTQTRRVVKLQPIDILTHKPPWCNKATRIHNGKRCWFYLASVEPSRGGMFCCKHGEVGDRLWVRETWQVDPCGEWGTCYRATGHSEGCKFPSHLWRPSIHMPRWASRITLAITDVQVQRVQEISHKDALAEGVEYDVSQDHGSPLCRFQQLWDALNAKRGFSWESNPWVWVITFSVVR